MFVIGTFSTVWFGCIIKTAAETQQHTLTMKTVTANTEDIWFLICSDYTLIRLDTDY